MIIIKTCHKIYNTDILVMILRLNLLKIAILLNIFQAKSFNI